jgi:hypothetical protein
MWDVLWGALRRVTGVRSACSFPPLTGTARTLPVLVKLGEFTFYRFLLVFPSLLFRNCKILNVHTSERLNV